MGEVQSKPVRTADRGLCCKGNSNCNGSQLAGNIQGTVQAGGSACRHAKQQHDMGNVPEAKRSKAVPAAGELSGLHNSEGILRKIFRRDLCDRHR